MSDNLTLSAFAEFCESKPADEEYDYGDWRACACAQYARHCGKEYRVAAAIEYGNFWQRAEYYAAGINEPRTFGALASRLRSALETKP